MGYTPPSFSPADNPAADSSSLLTRTLTFLYLPVFNFLLLVFPVTLSFDWSMGAIPLIESLADCRVILTIVFYTLFIILVKHSVSNILSKAESGHSKSSVSHSQNEVAKSSAANGGLSNGSGGVTSHETPASNHCHSHGEATIHRRLRRDSCSSAESVRFVYSHDTLM